MFKETFINLCNKKGVAPSAVCVQLGLSNATYSKWTDESVPRRATLQRIAEYFGVSIDYLLGKQEQSTTEDDELTEYLEELKNRSEMRMLFSLAKDATKEDVERAIAIIEALRKAKNG